MQDLKVIAIYFHEYIPSRTGDKPIIDYYRLLKYSENLEDATAWAYNYVRDDFKRRHRGCENPEMDAIGDYVSDYIRFEVTSISECLDTLIKHTRLIEDLTRRVSAMEHALGMEYGIAKRLEG